MIQPNKERKQNFTSLLQPLEKDKFGDRCPAGFRKLDLLGRGGIALVWQDNYGLPACPPVSGAGGDNFKQYLKLFMADASGFLSNRDHGHALPGEKTIHAPPKPHRTI